MDVDLFADAEIALGVEMAVDQPGTDDLHPFDEGVGAQHVWEGGVDIGDAVNRDDGE